MPHDLRGDVHDGAPDIHRYRDVFCIPKGGGGPLAPGAGLFDKAGRLIGQTRQFHGVPPIPKTDVPLALAGPRNGEEPSIRRAVFGGVVADHYGHFLTECLNTLWHWEAARAAGTKLLFLSHLDADAIFAIPWAARLLALACVAPEDVVVPTRPVHVEELIVPGPAFCEDGFVFAEYGNACRRIGARAAAPAATHAGPVYLARSRLRAGNVRLENEDALAASLASRGVKVCFPEEMTVDMQIATLAATEAAIGLVGSAFHTSILLAGVRGIALSPESQVRRSYPLMDAVSGARIDYRQLDAIEPVESGGFNHGWRLAAPERTADAVLRAVDELGSGVSPR